MRRLGRHLGQCVVALLAGCVLAGTAAAARPDKLSTAIEQRLARAGNLTFPMTPVSDYFGDHMAKPENGFETGHIFHPLRHIGARLRNTRGKYPAITLAVLFPIAA